MERVSLNFSIITQNKAILSRYKPSFFPSNFIFQKKKYLQKSLKSNKYQLVKEKFCKFGGIRRTAVGIH
jgi:hypothetical protein